MTGATHLQLAALVILLFAALKLFKDLDVEPRRWLLPLLIAGGAVGLIAGLLDLSYGDSHIPLPAVPLALVLALGLLRTRRPDTDYVEGILSGTMLGMTASLTAMPFSPRSELLAIELVLGGAVAGLIIYLAASSLRRIRFAILLGAAALIIAGTSALRRLVEIDPWMILIVSLLLIFVACIGFVLVRWTMLRQELLDESALGVIDRDDIGRLANPFSRLQTGVWQERNARREFVRVVTELAIRKRRQRRMPPDLARLRQLEIMKLRMAARELMAIELAVRHDRDA